MSDRGCSKGRSGAGKGLEPEVGAGMIDSVEVGVTEGL